MLMTKPKSLEMLAPHLRGKVFLVTCQGCREVTLCEAEQDTEVLIQKISANGKIVGQLTADYICNPAYFKERFDPHAEAITEADTILVFACGVGVQAVADAFPGKRVCTGNDTYPLPGSQGVTPLEHDCDRCGQCYLNLTGGICPITACAKGLINGQCGGVKNGMCEVDPNMECGWERITRRLTQLGRQDLLNCPIQLRDYGTDPEC